MTKARHGGWADNLTKDEVSEKMRLLAEHKHSLLSTQQKREHALKMVQAKKTRKQLRSTIAN